MFALKKKESRRIAQMIVDMKAYLVKFARTQNMCFLKSLTG